MIEMHDRVTTVDTHQFLEVLSSEYLRDYVREGGAAVKFVAGPAARLDEVARDIAATASRDGWFHAHLDAGRLDGEGRKPELHRIDRFFFALMAHVDLRQWAVDQARGYLRDHGLQLAPGRALSDLDGIASDNGRDAADLLNQYHRDVQQGVLSDAAMAVPFRNAVAALVRAQLIPDVMTPTTEEVLLLWFAGKTMPGAASALKKVRIFERIVQSNARAMLASLCHQVPRTGKAGTVVVLDMRAYEHRKLTRPQRASEQLRRAQEAAASGASLDQMRILLAEEEVPAVTYSDTAYMHLLATLRRFVDEIDTFERFLLVVLTSPAFYDLGSPRNFHDYDALQTRIGLEVRDSQRANPAASLVFL